MVIATSARRSCPPAFSLPTPPTSPPSPAPHLPEIHTYHTLKSTSFGTEMPESRPESPHDLVSSTAPSPDPEPISPKLSLPSFKEGFGSIPAPPPHPYYSYAGGKKKTDFRPTRAESLELKWTTQAEPIFSRSILHPHPVSTTLPRLPLKILPASSDETRSFPPTPPASSPAWSAKDAPSPSATSPQKYPKAHFSVRSNTRIWSWNIT